MEMHCQHRKTHIFVTFLKYSLFKSFQDNICQFDLV